MSDPESHDAPVIPLRPWAFGGPTERSELGAIADASAGAEAGDHVGAMLDNEPFAFLDATANLAMLVPHKAQRLLGPLDLRDPREIRAAAVAMRWLLHEPEPEMLGLDLPLWLRRLDRAETTACKRRHDHDDHRTSHLVEIRFADDKIGTAQIGIDHLDGDAIANAFVTDEPLEHVEVLMRGGRASHEPGYRRVGVASTERALMYGAGRFAVAPFDTGPLNPWPANLPVVHFVLRVVAGDYRPEPRLGMPT